MKCVNINILNKPEFKTEVLFDRHRVLLIFNVLATAQCHVMNARTPFSTALTVLDMA